MLSNYPPGVADSDIDRHFGDEDEDEDAHDEFCGVNRVNRRPCDCDHDS